VDSNQLVDSAANPDTISIVRKASRMKIKEDVMVLVITAKIARRPIIVNRKGVKSMSEIQVNIEKERIKRKERKE
jgi:hypothetical protein